MASWRRCTVGDLCDANAAELKTGPFGSQLHSYDYVEEGVPVIPTEAVRDRQIDHSVLPKITQVKAEELARHRLRQGDILFARRGVQATGHVGYVREAEDGFLCGTGAIRLRVNPEHGDISPDFLSHVFADPASVEWFKFHAIGATMPNLNEDIIRAFPLSIPPIIEQRAIAHILGTLDDKIDLNRRMNETLEAMARALFKSWFVDFNPVHAKAQGRNSGLPKNLADLFPDSFEDSELGEIPKGWRVAKLGDPDLFPFVVPGVQADATTLVHYIATANVQRDYISGETEGVMGSLPSRANMQPGNGRVWFAKMKDSPKYLWTMSEHQEWWSRRVLSTGFAGLQSTSPVYEAFLYCHISGSGFDRAKNQLATGTTMQALNNDTIRTIPLVVPTPLVVAQFDGIVRLLFRRRWSSSCESRALTVLRDTLLPKLISGELQVKDAGRLLVATGGQGV